MRFDMKLLNLLDYCLKCAQKLFREFNHVPDITIGVKRENITKVKIK